MVEVPKSTDWAMLVRQVRGGDPLGTERLYKILSDHTRSKLNRSVDPEGIQDCLHDIFIVVLESILSESIRDPDRLMGFVKTVTHRCVARHIRLKVALRRHFVAIDRDEYPNYIDAPDRVLASADNAETALGLLRRLRQRDRDLLTRYYFFEEDPGRICRAMKLTETQFRLFKSRALSRCAEVARRSNRAA